MARELISAARAADGQAMPGAGLGHSIYRRERGLPGLPERHKLNYCRALGIKAARSGPHSRPRSTFLRPAR